MSVNIYDKNTNSLIPVAKGEKGIISITRLEYEALSDEEKMKDVIYNIVDDNIPVVNDTSLYSTEERIIGTWIDGKPIYRKTMTCTFNCTANQWTNVLNIASMNIKQLINCTALRTNDNVFYSPFAMVSTDGNLKFYANPAFSGTGYITLEYTKTT